MITKITKMYLRHYSDSGQRTLYFEFTDARGCWGRLECPAEEATKSARMQALLARGEREGVSLSREVW